MIHIFNSINNVIVKINYFMKRIKFIIQNLKNCLFVMFFQTNAFNKYYVVFMFVSHVYRTRFLSTIEYYCYFKMKQNFIEVFETYFNIQTKNILFSNFESTFSNVSKNTMFSHFMNNEFNETKTFDDLMRFLHFHYFSRLIWSRLIINLKKLRFFVNNLFSTNWQQFAIDLCLLISKVW